jgi:death-on-curing protein
VNYLTPAQILFIHARLIDETGGVHGIRDVGLLESAAARPAATFGGEDLYADLFEKAAALFESLVRNHPFLDGNKRAAIASTGLFLRINGVRLTAANEELERFTLHTAEARPELADSVAWLRARTVGNSTLG